MPVSNRRRAQRQAAAYRAARRAHQSQQNDAQIDAGHQALENRRRERNQQRR